MLNVNEGCLLAEPRTAHAAGAERIFATAKTALPGLERSFAGLPDTRIRHAFVERMIRPPLTDAHVDHWTELTTPPADQASSGCFIYSVAGYQALFIAVSKNCAVLAAANLVRASFVGAIDEAAL